MANDKESQETQDNALKQMKLLIMVVLVIAMVAPFLSTSMAVKGINAKLNKLSAVAKSEPTEENQAEAETLPMAFFKPMEFLVNLGDTDGSHYLRATVSLGARLSKEDLNGEGKKGGGHGGGESGAAPEPAFFNTIKAQEPIVRDTIISVISNYTMDDLVAPAGKNKLKETIRNRLRSEFNREDLEVYFTAFTLQ